MFRGEPLALTTILTGLVFFPVTLLLGIYMPGSLLESSLVGIYSAHYVSAFFGWIGLVILGAQLQFFRAIAGLRKLEPEFLRYPYYFLLLFGVIALISGILIQIELLVYSGLAFYSIAILIHTIWLLPQLRNSLFKFPLNYLLGSHLFIIIALYLTWIQALETPLRLAINFEVIHFLGIGWISLNLQGALIRALPMFVGQVIDRPLRQYIEYHFVFSLIASIGLSISLSWLSEPFVWIFGSMWFLSWIWVAYLLIKSIFASNRAIDNPYTLMYFLPGILFMAFGAMIGFQTSTSGYLFPRGVHIHLNLLAGLSLIMLGAINRITSFQMFTLVYTGRKEEGIRIDDFLHGKWLTWINPGLVLSLIAILLYFADMISEGIFLIAIIIYIVHVLLYFVPIVKNVVHTLREYPNSIPYDKKPSEVN